MKITRLVRRPGIFRLFIVCLLVAAALAPAQAVRADDNPWTATGNMPAVKASFSGVVLNNGKVLTAGGTGSGTNYLRTAELYDPSAGTWAATGSMSLSGYRMDFAMSLLSDGRALAVGGVYNGAASSSVEIYDPGAGTWTAAASIPTATAYETATLLNNQLVLVAGGTNNKDFSLNTSYLYNASANSWSSAGVMNSARRNHTATLLSDGKVLVAGGSATDGTSALASIDLYDPSTGWAAAGGLNPMSSARHSHTATRLADGRVLVAGGTANISTAIGTAEVYDPATGNWSSAGTLVTARYGHAAVLLGDGKVLVVGGTDGDNPLSSAELYDPAMNSWTAVAYPMSTARMGHAAFMLGNGKVLVAGGSDGSSILRSAELYYADPRLPQTITVTTPPPASAVYQGSFSVAATASSGLPVTYSSGSPSVCTNVGATFTMASGTGTCVVQFDQPGDATYAPAPRVTQNVTATKASQSISVTTSAPASAVYNTQFTVAATASSGLAVAYGNSGVCSRSGAVYTMTSGTGDCTVTYNQPGDANYAAAPQVTETTHAAKASQTITVTTHAPSSATYNTSFGVAATASSGLAVAYSSGNTGVCTASGATFSMVSGTGSCPVRFDQAGNANYEAAAQVTEYTNAQKAAQSISVSTPAPSQAAYNAHFTVAATAPGGAVAYSSSGVCTNTGPEYTMTGASGTCTVIYNQPGNENYAAAPQVTNSVTAIKADQTITVTSGAPPSKTYNTSFTVAASAPGGAVTYSSSGACTNTGATFTMTSGTGTCSVIYNQSGNANYNPAPQITESTTATKASQTITVTTQAPDSAVYGTSFSVAATAPGGAVTYSSGSPGVCSVTGATFTMTSGTGTCVVQYDQAGNDNYAPAPRVTKNVTALRASQSITITSHAPASQVYNTNFSVAATAPGGAVTYSSGSPGVCSVTGATFTMLSGTGTCTVQYDQAGNSNYAPATRLTEDVTAAKAAQTIYFDPLPDRIVTDPDFTVTATASSGLAVTFSVGAGDQCTIAGSTVHLTAVGSCTVTASQPGNANYLAAAPVSQTFDILTNKTHQTITFDPLPDKTYLDPDFTVSATASSGLTVTFSAGAGSQCTVSGNTVHLTGAGSCTVIASQAGNDEFLEAEPVARTFSIAKYTAAVNISGTSVRYDGLPKAVNVTTTPSGLAVEVTYEGTGGTVYARTTTPPTEVGTYAVSVVINEANYQGSAAATLTILPPLRYVYIPVIIKP